MSKYEPLGTYLREQGTELVPMTFAQIERVVGKVRERWPETAIHLSVQANTVNYAAVEFWRSPGLARVILSRELSLDGNARERQQ